MQEVLSNKGKCFNVVITIFKSADVNKRSPKQPCEAPHEWPHWEPVACKFCMYVLHLACTRTSSASPSRTISFRLQMFCCWIPRSISFALIFYYIDFSMASRLSTYTSRYNTPRFWTWIYSPHPPHGSSPSLCDNRVVWEHGLFGWA